MKTQRIHASAFLWVLLFFKMLSATPLWARTQSTAHKERPRLIVMLVIDQFRADYLTRFQSRFLPSVAKDGSVGGFRHLMEQGAWYPFAEYDILQSTTGPGHSTILTGAFPFQSGISSNWFLNPATLERMYCMEDPAYSAVGAPNKSPNAGTSPAALIGSTLGDELKNAGFPSRVVTMALKDRAAILLGGHRPDLAFWYDPKSLSWISSTYYLPDGKLPSWMTELNSRVQARKGEKLIWNAEGPGTGLSSVDAGTLLADPPKIGTGFPHEALFGSRESLVFPTVFEMTEEAAEKAVTASELGTHPGTETYPDLFAVSFSNHDYLGHQFGPNSREMEEMTVHEDRSISKFLNFLRRKIPGGLSRVAIVLTADHGVLGNPEWLQKNRMKAGRISDVALSKKINAALDDKFGKPARGSWIPFAYDLNYFLNHEAIVKKGLAPAEVENEVRRLLVTEPGIAFVFTATDVQQRRLPPGMHERQILHTWFKGRSGDVVGIPRPFFIVGDEDNAVHMTGYSYDRSVPLILMGPWFKAGRYSERALVNDIAPTLAWISGVLPPALSEGRVLSEILGTPVGHFSRTMRTD